MIGYILTGLLLIFTSRKFYKYRANFKQLSKKEWLQFGASFLLAWAGAVFIIIGGSNITDMIEIGIKQLDCTRDLVEFCCIFLCKDSNETKAG